MVPAQICWWALWYAISVRFANARSGRAGLRVRGPQGSVGTDNEFYASIKNKPRGTARPHVVCSIGEHWVRIVQPDYAQSPRVSEQGVLVQYQTIVGSTSA